MLRRLFLSFLYLCRVEIQKQLTIDEYKHLTIDNYESKYFP